MEEAGSCSRQTKIRLSEEAANNYVKEVFHCSASLASPLVDGVGLVLRVSLS